MAEKQPKIEPQRQIQAQNQQSQQLVQLPGLIPGSMSNKQYNDYLKKEKVDLTVALDSEVVISILSKDVKQPNEINFLKKSIMGLSLFQKQKDLLNLGSTSIHLFQKMKLQQFKPKQVLFNYGEFGVTYYIVLSGACDLLIPAKQNAPEGPSAPATQPQIVQASQTPQQPNGHGGKWNTVRQALIKQKNEQQQPQQQPEEKPVVNEPDIDPDEPYQDHLKRVYPNMNFICSFKAGQAFGEIALITKQRRTGTVICREDCYVMTLTKDSFDQIMGKYHEHLIDKNIQFLNQFSFLKDIPKSIQMSLLHFMKTQTFQNNQIIYSENQPATMLYIIKSGQIELSKMIDVQIDDDLFCQLQEQNCKTVSNQKLNKFSTNSQKKKRVTLCVVGDNSYFGELEIINQQEKRTSQARCLCTAELQFISIDSLINYAKGCNILQKLIECSENKKNWLNKRQENLRSSIIAAKKAEIKGLSIGEDIPENDDNSYSSLNSARQQDLGGNDLVQLSAQKSRLGLSTEENTTLIKTLQSFEKSQQPALVKEDPSKFKTPFQNKLASQRRTVVAPMLKYEAIIKNRKSAPKLQKMSSISSVFFQQQASFQTKNQIEEQEQGAQNLEEHQEDDYITKLGSTTNTNRKGKQSLNEPERIQKSFHNSPSSGAHQEFWLPLPRQTSAAGDKDLLSPKGHVKFNDQLQHSASQSNQQNQLTPSQQQATQPNNNKTQLCQFSHGLYQFGLEEIYNSKYKNFKILKTKYQYLPQFTNLQETFSEDSKKPFFEKRRINKKSKLDVITNIIKSKGQESAEPLKLNSQLNLNKNVLNVFALKKRMGRKIFRKFLQHQVINYSSQQQMQQMQGTDSGFHMQSFQQQSQESAWQQISNSDNSIQQGGGSVGGVSGGGVGGGNDTQTMWVIPEVQKQLQLQLQQQQQWLQQQQMSSPQIGDASNKMTFPQLNKTPYKKINVVNKYYCIPPQSSGLGDGGGNGGGYFSGLSDKSQLEAKSLYDTQQLQCTQEQIQTITAATDTFIQYEQKNSFSNNPIVTSPSSMSTMQKQLNSIIARKGTSENKLNKKNSVLSKTHHQHQVLFQKHQLISSRLDMPYKTEKERVQELNQVIESQNNKIKAKLSSHKSELEKIVKTSQ